MISCWATTASWRCLKPPSGTGEPPNPAFLNSASHSLPASAPEPTSLAALAYEPLSKSFTALASASTAEPKPSRQLPRISFLSSPRLGSLRRLMMAFKSGVAESRVIGVRANRRDEISGGLAGKQGSEEDKDGDESPHL
nr:hypothetical protein Iba_chr04dCG6800 [Ipomoea batatas]